MTIRTAECRHDAYDAGVAQEAQRQRVEHQDQTSRNNLPGVDGGQARQQQVQRVGKQDDEGDAGAHQLQGEERRDDNPGARAERDVGQVRVGDERGVVVHALGQQLARVRGDGRRQGEDRQPGDPSRYLEGQGEAEHAHADEGVDRVEDGLREGALALDGEHHLVALLDLLDEDRLVLAVRGILDRPLLVRDPPSAALAERYAVAHGAVHGAVGRCAPERAVAADNVRGREMRGDGKDAGPAGEGSNMQSPGGLDIEQRFTLPVVQCASDEPGRRPKARAGLATGLLRRRRFQVLAQESCLRLRRALDMAPSVLKNLPILVSGKDEARPARDDLGECCGSLPAPGERSEAVDTANVCYRGEVVRD